MARKVIVGLDFDSLSLSPRLPLKHDSDEHDCSLNKTHDIMTPMVRHPELCFRPRRRHKRRTMKARRCHERTSFREPALSCGMSCENLTLALDLQVIQIEHPPSRHQAADGRATIDLAVATTDFQNHSSTLVIITSSAPRQPESRAFRVEPRSFDLAGVRAILHGSDVWRTASKISISSSLPSRMEVGQQCHQISSCYSCCEVQCAISQYPGKSLSLGRTTALFA